MTSLKKTIATDTSSNGLPITDSCSIIGRKPSQEDSFLIMERNGISLIFVADGVGGHGHGDWASNSVVNTFKDEFDNIVADTDLQKFLLETAKKAAQIVLDKGVEDSSFKYCGTTISGFVVVGDEYITINIGDSRVYLWSEEILSRETHDHSVVQELLDSGSITEDEAFTHPRRNMMTSAIGQSLDVMRVDVSSKRKLKHGDILLAFSDGVHDALTDNQIFSLLQSYSQEPNLAQKIVDSAFNAGGKDNITALIYRYL